MTGTLIRSRRLRLGLSRHELAHSVGVSSEQLGAWEEERGEIGCPHALEQILRQSESRVSEPSRLQTPYN